MKITLVLLEAMGRNPAQIRAQIDGVVQSMLGVLIIVIFGGLTHDKLLLMRGSTRLLGMPEERKMLDP